MLLLHPVCGTKKSIYYTKKNLFIVTIIVSKAGRSPRKSIYYLQKKNRTSGAIIAFWNRCLLVAFVIIAPHIGQKKFINITTPHMKMYIIAPHI